MSEKKLILVGNPSIPNETDRFKKVATEEPWEVYGYSEKYKISILKKGKVIKASSYRPRMEKDYHLPE